MAKKRDQVKHEHEGRMSLDDRQREVRRDIDRRREDISAILHALENKLSPRRMVDDFIDSIQQSSNRSRLFRAVRENPIPSILTAIGLGGAGWLAYEARGTPSGPAPQVERKREQARERIEKLPRETAGGRLVYEEELSAQATTPPPLPGTKPLTSDVYPSTGYAPAGEPPAGEPSLRERGSEMLETSKEKGQDLKERAGEKYEGLKERAGDLKERVSDKLSGMKEGASERGAGMKETAKEKYFSAKERISEKAASAREHLGSAKESLGERAGVMKERSAEYGAMAKEKMLLAKDRTADTYHQNPLLGGLAVMAAGLLAGLMIPSTRREGRLMGAKRDQLVEGVRQTSEQLLQKGKAVAGTAASAASEKAHEEGIGPEDLASKVSAVASTAVGAAKEEAKNQDLTPEGVAGTAKENVTTAGSVSGTQEVSGPSMVGGTSDVLPSAEGADLAAEDVIQEPQTSQYSDELVVEGTGTDVPIGMEEERPVSQQPQQPAYGQQPSPGGAVPMSEQPPEGLVSPSQQGELVTPSMSTEGGEETFSEVERAERFESMIQSEPARPRGDRVEISGENLQVTGENLEVTQPGEVESQAPQTEGQATPPPTAEQPGEEEMQRPPKIEPQKPEEHRPESGRRAA